MKIVLAPDSFKGSLSSPEAAFIMKNAILSLGQNHQIEEKPMADGGEGTVDAILTASDGIKVSVSCTGPLGEKISTYYAIIDQHTAVIEIANIAGLVQVPAEERNPDNTTTYGLGEVMKDALDRGCTSFIIGLGGSATNDAGLGMLTALGMKAFDKNDKEVDIYGHDLLNINRISLDGMDPRLAVVSIKVACDVENPLIGEKGASAVFGPQKGITKGQIATYDKAMKHFACLVEENLSVKNFSKKRNHLIDNKKEASLSNIQGAGAAGGLGFALLTLGAELLSGAELVGKASSIEDAIMGADLVITGEGQSDEQTLYGKAPGYIADLANQYNVPVILISGGLAGNLDPLLKKFTCCFSIINKPLTVEACMRQAEELLFQQTKNIINLMHRLR